MRLLAKRIFCLLYKYSGAMFLHETLARWRGKTFVPILLFHRVTDDIPVDGLTVSTAWFRDLCRMLRARFNVVPLAEVVRLIQEGETPPWRTIAITFDDSYHDNLDAARMLGLYGLPATFFVPTHYVGTDLIFPWDAHLPKMPNLSWADVHEMIRLGHDVGSHTVHHVDLGKCLQDEARNELAESKRVLEAKLGRPARHLAYPFGQRENFKMEYLPLVRETGYEAVVSGFGGFADPKQNEAILPREPVHYFTDLVHLELHLAGCLHWIYALKKLRTK